MILVFLSPPEPPETPYSDTDSNNMLAMVWTQRQLTRQVGGSVNYDSSSTVAEASRLVTGASGTTLDGGVRFPGDIDSNNMLVVVLTLRQLGIILFE